MTDNSNAAPERIWFTKVGNNVVPNSERRAPDDVEYIRADLASAQIAAAYRAAAEACTYIIKNYDVMRADGKTYESQRVQKAAKGMVSLAREDIRSLTPDDANAKLNAMLKAERAKARDAVCKTKVVNDFCEGWCQDIGAPGDYDDCSACQIERAIRALAQEDE